MDDKPKPTENKKGRLEEVPTVVVAERSKGNYYAREKKNEASLQLPASKGSNSCLVIGLSIMLIVLLLVIIALLQRIVTLEMISSEASELIETLKYNNQKLFAYIEKLNKHCENVRSKEITPEPLKPLPTPDPRMSAFWQAVASSQN